MLKETGGLAGQSAYKRYKKVFINGIIKPDLIEKEKSHYLDENGTPKLEEFLKDIPLDTDYNKGYFLHLVTDYLFYNKLLRYTVSNYTNPK